MMYLPRPEGTTPESYISTVDFFFISFGTAKILWTITTALNPPL